MVDQVTHAEGVPAGVGVEFKDISPYIEELLKTVIKGMK